MQKESKNDQMYNILDGYCIFGPGFHTADVNAIQTEFDQHLKI